MTRLTFPRKKWHPNLKVYQPKNLRVHGTVFGLLKRLCNYISFVVLVKNDIYTNSFKDSD